MNRFMKFLGVCLSVVVLLAVPSRTARAQAVIEAPVLEGITATGFIQSIAQSVSILSSTIESLDIQDMNLDLLKDLRGWIDTTLGEGSTFQKVRGFLYDLQMWGTMEKSLENAASYCASTVASIGNMSSEGFDRNLILQMINSVTYTLQCCKNLYDQTMKLMASSGLSVNEKKEEMEKSINTLNTMIEYNAVCTVCDKLILQEAKDLTETFNILDGRPIGFGVNKVGTGQSSLDLEIKDETLKDNSNEKVSIEGALGGTGVNVDKPLSKLLTILELLFVLLGAACLPFAYLRYVRGDYLAETSFIKIGVGLVLGAVVVFALKGLVKF